MKNVHGSPLPRPFTKYTPSLFPVVQTPGPDGPHSPKPPYTATPPYNPDTSLKFFKYTYAIGMWVPIPSIRASLRLGI